MNQTLSVYELPFVHFDYFLYLVDKVDLPTISRLCSANKRFAKFCRSNEVRKIVESKLQGFYRQDTIIFLRSIGYNPRAIKSALERNVESNIIIGLIKRNYEISDQDYSNLLKNGNSKILYVLLNTARVKKDSILESRIINRLAELGDYSQIRSCIESGRELRCTTKQLLLTQGMQGNVEAYILIQDDKFDYEGLIVSFQTPEVINWLLDNYKCRNVSNHLKLINMATLSQLQVFLENKSFQALLTDSEKTALQSRIEHLQHKELEKKRLYDIAWEKRMDFEEDVDQLEQLWYLDQEELRSQILQQTLRVAKLENEQTLIPTITQITTFSPRTRTVPTRSLSFSTGYRSPPPSPKSLSRFSGSPLSR